MKKAQERDEFLRKRAERQRKIRKRRLTVMFCLFIFLLLCVGVVLSLTVFFPIQNINVSGSSYYTSKELQKATGVKIGDNLFTVSGERIESKLKESLPYVESIKLTRKLPDTLNITVTDADQYACYIVDEKAYIVSRSGWVLEETEQPPEKVFSVIGAEIKCDIGSKAVFTEQNQESLVNNIADISENLSIPLNSIDITNSVGIVIKVDGRFEVNLGTLNSLEEKIKHLGGMLKSIENDKSGKINLSMWTAENPQGTFTPGILE